MRALRLTDPASSTVSFTESAAPPTPSQSGQYLIRVHATAITANELVWNETISNTYPIPGHDVSGTIVSVPAAAASSDLKIGDEVFALIAFNRDGAAAEFVVLEAHELARKPAHLGHEEAAAIPLSALTAWQALFTHAALEEGQSVLVLGAAGGVGTIAVQLASWKGARVAGTCSANKAEFVKSLGAQEVIDYKTRKVEGKYDVVLDCVGGETQQEGWGNVKDGGILVSVAEAVQEKKKEQFPGIRSLFFIVEPDGQQLGKIEELVEKGSIKPVVDKIFDLEDGKAAFELLATGRTRGKIVLRVLKDIDI